MKQLHLILSILFTVISLQVAHSSILSSDQATKNSGNNDGLEIATIKVASQIYANSCPDDYPETYAIVSLSDMKTYPVDYAIANPRDVDFRFYCFGGNGVPRLYSMHNTGEGSKENEYKGMAGTLEDMTKRNQTHFLALPDNFDFDNATSESISKIDPSSIKLGRIDNVAVGDIIAIRSKKKVGLIKVVDITAPRALKSNNPTARVITLEIKFPKMK